MSILPRVVHRKDPFNTSFRFQWLHSPWGHGGSLDYFFDDHHQLRLRDNPAKLKLGKDGEFTYKVDTSGFKPDEIKVSVEGDQIVVTNEHKENNQGELVERHFTRRVVIPCGAERDTIESSIDEKGHLRITGTITPIEQSEKHSIPIEIKPPSSAASSRN